MIIRAGGNYEAEVIGYFTHLINCIYVLLWIVPLQCFQSKLWCHEKVLKFSIFASSRVAARGIILADSPSEELPGTDTDARNQVYYSMSAEGPSSSAPGVSRSAHSTLKQKFRGLWLYAVRKWPSVWPTSLYIFLVWFLCSSFVHLWRHLLLLINCLHWRKWLEDLILVQF